MGPLTGNQRPQSRSFPRYARLTGDVTTEGDSVVTGETVPASPDITTPPRDSVEASNLFKVCRRKGPLRGIRGPGRDHFPDVPISLMGAGSGGQGIPRYEEDCAREGDNDNHASGSRISKCLPRSSPAVGMSPGIHDFSA